MTSFRSCLNQLPTHIRICSIPSCSGRPFEPSISASHLFSPCQNRASFQRKPSFTTATASSESDTAENSSSQSTKRFTFEYISEETAARLERELEAARQESLKEYEDLKALLLKRTWRFGTIFSVYLLLAVSAEAAFAELVGAAASYGYFLWLIRDVDAYGPDTPVPMRAAEMVEPAFARNLAKLGAAYRQALAPRLLVLLGLVGACAAWNKVLPDTQIDMVTEGCAIGGFLSYKVALILKIYDDLKPRALTEEEMASLNRPKLEEIDDIEVDMYGRKVERKEEVNSEGEDETNG